MKEDEIKELAKEIRLERILTDPTEIFIRPEDLTFDIKGKGDLLNTFPVPDCENCELKCCPPRLELSLFDIARFMDAGLEHFISGTFEGYMDFSRQPPDNKNRPIERPVPYISVTAPALHCMFLGDNGKCNIYEIRIPVCRSFPLTLHQDKEGNLLVQWIAQCKSFRLSSDKTVFLKLFDDLIHSCNEWTSNHMMLIHAREELREMGFGKYLGDEQRYALKSANSFAKAR